MQNDQRRVRGTTLFLAELFVQLKRPEVSFFIESDGRADVNSLSLIFRIPEVPST